MNLKRFRPALIRPLRAAADAPAVLGIALAGLLVPWGCADFDEAEQEYCQRHFSTCTTSESTTTSLSDATWLSTSNGWGPVERDASNGEQNSGDGHTLTLNGVTYSKGFGVHANAEITFDLGKRCSVFTSDIGVDDEVDTKGSVVFQVFGDDTPLFDSGTMKGDSATQSVNINVSGRSTLKLVVTDAGDGHAFDHADWANARITCGTHTTAGIPLLNKAE